jgi:hypothetical protein
MWARHSCPSWRVGLAGPLLACLLWSAAVASSAQASGPLSGQPVVASAQATAQRAVAPPVNTAQRSVATVSRTVERTTAPVASVSAPVAEAPATVVRSVATTAKRAVPKPASTSPEKPAQQRKMARHRRGGGAVAKAATATPAPSAKRLEASRSTTPAAPVVEVAGTAAPQRSVSPRSNAPQHSGRGAIVAPVEDPAPAPAAPSSAAAATAAGSAAGATAFLALFALIALAAPRLGSLIRLPAGWAPMPPVLALPERPG